MLPAIIEGAADRLRPVLLTTLTTVIGLAPLLYEPSRQAQFLKPTVITLVYGLGFGIVIVLLMVPALLAIQEDVRSQTRAFRRALSGRGRTPAHGAALVGLGATALVFVASFGPIIVARVTGTPPSVSTTAEIWASFGLFLVFTALALAMVYLVYARKPATKDDRVALPKT